MKKQYDFSRGKQGKLYGSDILLRLPIYLDDELIAIFEEYAKGKNEDLQSAVNDTLRHNKAMLQALR
jgi:hypothetical protein